MPTRNFKQETARIREQATRAMQSTPLLSKQSTAVLFLAVIHLGLTEQRIRQTSVLEERRKQIHEFDRAKTAIERAIKGIHEDLERRHRPASHTGKQRRQPQNERRIAAMS